MRHRRIIFAGAALATAAALAAGAEASLAAINQPLESRTATAVASPSTTTPPTTVVGGTGGTTGKILPDLVNLPTVNVLSPDTAPTLHGTYNGTITADLGSSAPMSFFVSGQQNALTATARISAGAHVDCHGDNTVPAKDIPMTGHFTGVASDGSSLYDLSGSFGFEASVHVDVTVTITGARLSANGEAFGGTANIFLDPDYVSSCSKSWPFSTTLFHDTHAKTTVPSVVGMTPTAAKAALQAAQLNTTSTSEIDCSYDSIGLVSKQSLSPGNIVNTGTTVKITIGTRPPNKPGFCSPSAP